MVAQTKFQEIAEGVYLPIRNRISSDTLEPGVYWTEFKDNVGWVLDRKADKYNLPSKIYGDNTQFAKYILKTYDETTGSLGILLNGIKGTGKTLCAQQICNLSNLPVILLKGIESSLLEMIGTITQPCVIFVDEYEKVVAGSGSGDRSEKYEASGKLLAVMDGAFTAGRKIWLLTSNELRLHDAMKSRPGRIRYIKEFGFLDVQTITEIVDDLLLDSTFRESCIDYISGLSLITVDIVKAVIQEINIHGVTPSVFKSVFNAEECKYTWDLYQVVEDNKQVLIDLDWYDYETSPAKFFDPGDSFSVGGSDIGDIGIIESISPEQARLVVLITNHKGLYEDLDKMRDKYEKLPVIHRGVMNAVLKVQMPDVSKEQAQDEEYVPMVVFVLRRKKGYNNAYLADPYVSLPRNQFD